MAVGLAEVLLAASALFFVFLAARAFGFKACAACAAFACAWLGLLALRYFGEDIDPALIGVLMGGSVVGVMYLLREKLPEEYRLFTFPFLATFFALAYLLLADVPIKGSAYLLLAALWLGFGIIFLARNNEAVKGAAQKLIECCKNW